MVRASSRKNYTGFSIQKEKVEEIKKFITDNPDLHYKTVVDFINDAIKEKLNKKEIVIKTDDLELIKSQLDHISGQIINITGSKGGVNKT